MQPRYSLAMKPQGDHKVTPKLMKRKVQVYMPSTRTLSS